MDTNQNRMVDQDEFITFMFKAFKNFEDNIEYLSKDIKDMGAKIEEVTYKLT